MNSQYLGVLYGLAAFVAWGFLPAYWKQLQPVDSFEILCHRIIWTEIFLCLIISLQQRWPEVARIVRDRSCLKKLGCSGLLIGINWFVYIWAVNSGHVLETSLGYYITPMVNILLGFLLLGERFNRAQSIALACVLTGVGYSLAGYGDLPLFGLTLAFSFAFYGFARKKTAVRPLPGLLIETSVLLLPALGYVAWRMTLPETLFLRDTQISLWLVGSGIATSMPLLWFAAAANRLRLSTIGILQYLAPSIAFALGVFVYREPFDRHHLVTFGLIWAGVFIYSMAMLRQVSSGRRKAPAPNGRSGRDES